MLKTASQIARSMGVSTKTILRMKGRGEIPYYQIGRQVRFKLSEVERATKGGMNAKKERKERRSNSA